MEIRKYAQLSLQKNGHKSRASLSERIDALRKDIVQKWNINVEFFTWWDILLSSLFLVTLVRILEIQCSTLCRHLTMPLPS